MTQKHFLINYFESYYIKYAIYRGRQFKQKKIELLEPSNGALPVPLPPPECEPPWPSIILLVGNNSVAKKKNTELFIDAFRLHSYNLTASS